MPHDLPRSGFLPIPEDSEYDHSQTGEPELGVRDQDDLPAAQLPQPRESAVERAHDAGFLAASRVITVPHMPVAAPSAAPLAKPSLTLRRNEARGRVLHPDKVQLRARQRRQRGVDALKPIAEKIAPDVPTLTESLVNLELYTPAALGTMGSARLYAGLDGTMTLGKAKRLIEAARRTAEEQADELRRSMEPRLLKLLEELQLLDTYGWLLYQDGVTSLADLAEARLIRMGLLPFVSAPRLDLLTC